MGIDKETYELHTSPMQSHINVGFGSDITISELVGEVKAVIGYQGKTIFDPSMPDGVPRKWMDSTRLNNLGWSAKFKLIEGLALTYSDMLKDI